MLERRWRQCRKRKEEQTVVLMTFEKKTKKKKERLMDTLVVVRMLVQFRFHYQMKALKQNLVCLIAVVSCHSG